MKVLTAAEMKEVDRLTTERCQVPSLTLMENAGKSVAEFIRERFPHLERRRIVVLCGKGNNGGDGFVVARHLLAMGAKSVVIPFAGAGDAQGDAAVNRKRWRDVAGELRPVLNSAEWQAAKSILASADIVVDALLGTGVRGPVEGLLREVIDDVNGLAPNPKGRAAVVAVDIPSGLPADTGLLEGPVVAADYTVTFTAPKIGMLLGSASKAVGRLVVREIGSPRELLEEMGNGQTRWVEPGELEAFAGPRQPEGHKGDYGHALIVAGSVGKSGAAVLASWAALRVGAGLVTCATPAPVLPIVASHTPEIMTEPLAATETGGISLRAIENNYFDALAKGKRVVAIGPGLGAHADTQHFVRTVVARRPLPVVLDADGLNAFVGRAHELKDSRGMLAITPHPGEMAHLLSCAAADVQARRLDVARKAAADWNAYVILKGHHTVIASPDGAVYVNSTGNPGMGTGGTGDVLTGMLAGLTAQYGAEAWPKLLAFGVYLHGLAGDIAYAESGQAPLVASDLIHAIPRAYQCFFGEFDRG